METQAAENAPSVSGSRHSSASKCSVAGAAARARGIAEAARARAAFSQQELELKMQKARLEANLQALELEKAAAAANAEAEVLEAAAQMEYDDMLSPKSAITPLEVQQRTEAYVAQHTQASPAYTGQPLNPNAPPPDISPPLSLKESPPSRHTPVLSPTSAHDARSVHSATQHSEYLPASEHQPHLPRCPTSYSYSPSRVCQQQGCSPGKHVSFQDHSSRNNIQSPPYVNQAPDMMDFAKYLARRELVTTGLNKFDDQPESFRAWQSSFFNATQGLELTASEELDLLIKWLGKESSDHVKRIRAVYVSNPQAALQLSWTRLQECYATPEVKESALFKRLDCFPRLSSRENSKLRELSDLLLELLSAQTDGYLPGLSYLDTPRGINPIVEKLPQNLQDKWLSTGSRYKEHHRVCYPPFSFFVEFVRCEAKARNDPSFILPNNSYSHHRNERAAGRQESVRTAISVHKTDVAATANAHLTYRAEREVRDPSKNCPLHDKPHPLERCRGFRMKPLTERKRLLKEYRRCFRCCSAVHMAKECPVKLKCNECESEEHCTTMHPDTTLSPAAFPVAEPHTEQQRSFPSEVTSRCTEVCGDGLPARSCAKICLVQVFPRGERERAVKMYAIIDDQSNRSLARSEFFQLFGIHGSPAPYLLRTCAGTTEMAGRKAVGFQIEAVDGPVSLDLPPLIECNEIMSNRSEIPTAEVALSHTHLRPVAPHIPELDPEAQILILLGRDLIRVHKVRQQINGPNNAPFAQRLDLGWVIVGEVCIDSARKPTVAVFKTNVLHNGRPSYLTPCQNHIHVKDKASYGGEQRHDLSSHSLVNVRPEDKLGLDVFMRTANDNKHALSFEDETFLNAMHTEFKRDEQNSWIAPLPFRSPRPRLPNNRAQALSRLHSLRRTLNKKPEMKEQFVSFMEKLFANKHAEQAAPLHENAECWYLPIFGVYHPQKPGQIRVVFDSSAQEDGLSLNSVLLSGPDLNNSLLGVLLRFRKELIALTADIQQMFYGFFVREDHRDYLRFLWHKDNNLTKEVAEYRMRVHVFGNSPSPAVAIYGLRKAAQEGEQKYGSDSRHFVERHFYVDDGLVSLPSESEAIDLLRRTQASLAESNLKLHKIASNSVTVMQAFPPEDRAAGLKDLGLDDGALPMQRSLGLCWDIDSDTFTFKVAVSGKPFTRRGVLSTVNSLFDPLGFAAPVTIKGRALLRELSTEVHDWDAKLPADKLNKWETWRKSLQDLSSLHIPRSYTQQSFSNTIHTELCLFSDASCWAIGAVAYLRVITTDGQCRVGFVLGKAKLAPQPEPTIPRLELCGAVLAVEMAELILEELDHKPDAVKFFCDSKVVLGYIHNESKRFFVYVHNRVHRIRQTTSPQQWHYVPTDQNPADLATRSVPASQLTNTTWFTGPEFLFKPHQPETHDPFQLVDPETDTDLRPQLTALATHLSEGKLTSERFQRFSTWESLMRAVSFLIHQATSFRSDCPNVCKRWHLCKKPRTPEELDAAKRVILMSVQRDAYPEEYAALQEKRTISKSSTILNLDPVMCDGLLRIGGRLKHASVEPEVRNPIILPKCHVTKLMVSHHHAKVQHQGRHFTEGAVRAAGLWVVAGKRLIGSVIHHCVTCRKLRGKLEVQKMADLPPERLSSSPPFTYVGLDVFGPWNVVTRRTRGGAAHSKRWAILFTCMCTRAVHIELIESMDSPSCINALRRFFALRGPAKQLRSDRGTNFIGASAELGMRPDDPNQVSTLKHLHENGCAWEFNPPHASHMGGVWERMIGIARRILDSMLLERKQNDLTHEVLCTLMAEVCAIMNARPLVPVSSDPSSPVLLTPAMLLTQRPGVSAPAGTFTEKDLFKCQWRQVQALANEFWTRWRNEYLHTLQPRRKWRTATRDLQPGDVVLLKESQSPRNEWPMGLVTAAFPSSDGKVRKVEIKTASQDKVKTFFRPITEVVLLLPKKGQRSSEDC